MDQNLLLTMFNLELIMILFNHLR